MRHYNVAVGGVPTKNVPANSPADGWADEKNPTGVGGSPVNFARWGASLHKYMVRRVAVPFPQLPPHDYLLHATIFNGGDLPTELSKIISTRGKSPVELFATNAVPASPYCTTAQQYPRMESYFSK